ncbi:MAG TPA: MalY/PatB family protein [Nocardioidaceae bacterium]
MASIERSVEDMRARRGTKWRKFPPDVLPAWVADMDFSVPDEVQAAVDRITTLGDYGYAAREGDESLAAAFQFYAKQSFGWDVDPDGVLPVGDLIQGMYSSVYAFSEPGDGIVVQTPIYPPFLDTIATTERRLVENRLLDDGTKYAVDTDGLRKVVDDRTRLLMIPNPHNPTGRTFSRDELQVMLDVAIEHDLIVVSDEIHADLVYSGNKHIPFASLGPEAAARTITLTSATKGFNIPGLRCALMYFGSQDLKARFHKRMPQRLLGSPNVIGIDATVAAWRYGQPWLTQVLAILEGNRTRVTEFLATQMPAVTYRQPQATYLAWLDCRALNLGAPPFDYFLEKAKVGLNDGAAFGEAGVGCVRLNFGTSPKILDEILGRLAESVREVALAPA